MPLQTAELLQPVPGDNPGGADVRYEPVYDQIKRARIEEADLPTGDWSRERKTADFALVIKHATDVLTKKSKDLQVAAWLTEALLKREGFTGLRSGLEVLHGLLDGFWDHLYPEIEDGDLEFRAAPLEWVAQYLGPTVRLVPVTASGYDIQAYRDSRVVGYEQDADTSDKREARRDAMASGKPSAEEFDQAFDDTSKAWYKQLIADLDGSLAAIEALDRVGEEKFGADAPRYSPLRDTILEVRQVAAQFLAKKLEQDPDPVEVEAPAEEEAGATAGAAPGAVAVSIVPKTRAEAEARVAAAARFLRTESPANPAPYLLLRGFRWGELRATAGRIDPRLLAAPPTDLRARLRGLLLDARWSELLEAGEEVMATPFGRGWLDLQRYVLAACAGLGSEYDPVASAIRGALLALLADLPDLPAMTLMDDTPTANVETQAWLRELGPLPEPGALALPVARDDGRGAARGPYERAMERVRAGEPEKAIELLIRQASQERSARDRFLRKSQAASIMVESGREAVALPILEDLLKEIEQHGLENWESGETVAQPMGLLYRCLKLTQGESSTTQNLYLRICRLDPLQAISIAGSPQQ